MAKKKIKKFRIYWKDGNNSVVYGETLKEAVVKTGKDLSAFEFFTDLALGHVCRANNLPAPF